MGEKASLNLGKRYWLIAFKGRSYTCKNTKSILGYALMVWSIVLSSFFFTVVFLQPFVFFFSLLIFESLFVLYTMVFAPFSPSTCELGVGSFSVQSRTSLNLLLLAVRLLVYCSGITSTLMRPESWLGSI